MARNRFSAIFIGIIIAAALVVSVGSLVMYHPKRDQPSEEVAFHGIAPEKEKVEEIEIAEPATTEELSLTPQTKEESSEPAVPPKPAPTSTSLPAPTPSPQSQPPPASASSQSASAEQILSPIPLDDLEAWARQYGATVYIVKTSQSDILSRSTGYDPALDNASPEEIEELRENIVSIYQNLRQLPPHVAEYIRGEPIFISTYAGLSQPASRCALFKYAGCDGSLGSEYVPPGLFSASSTFYASKGFPPGEGFELVYFGQGIFLQRGDGYLALHEFGHVVGAKGIHMTMGRAKLLESTTNEAIRIMYDEYDRLFQVPKEVSKATHATLPSGYMTFYSVTNSDENFAEHFTYYILDPEEFRARAEREPLLKEKYDFFKRYVFKGLEYR